MTVERISHIIMNNYNEKQICFDRLDLVSIDKMSNTIGEILSENDLDSKDIIRFRLLVEDVLRIWCEQLGEERVCELYFKKAFGKKYLRLQIDGRSVDPTKYEDELLLSISQNPNMTMALGLPAQYSYVDGINILLLRLPQKKTSEIKKVSIALVLAFVIGFALRFLCPDIGLLLSEKLFSPVMDTILRLISLISAPLVFITIICGITSMGDIVSFGKIGVKLTTRFVLITCLIVIITWLSLYWVNPMIFDVGSGGDNPFSCILNMILNIVPTDIVSPFQNGSGIQIIFLGICVGVGTLILSNLSKELIHITNQVNAIIHLLMRGIGKLLPLLVFLCLSSLIITSENKVLLSILIPLGVCHLLFLLLALIFLVTATIKTGISLKKLIKYQMPSFLLACFTASSTAAFPLSVQCCRENFGIENKLVQFGVPFGQVVFKPAQALFFTVLTMFFSKQYQIAVTPIWMITLIVMTTILCVASAPVPGGPLSILSLLFTQLSIPAAAIPIAATLLIFCDYFGTAVNISCLQDELLIYAKKMNLLHNCFI